MSVKPIIDIEVNDAEFRRFYDLFEAYSAELDEMPEAWRTLGAAMGESTKGLEGGALSAKESLAVAAAQAGIISEALREATKASSGLDRSVDKGAKSMDRLRKGAEGVGKAISSVGGWIVKLGAIGGLGAIFTGLGFGELADSAFRRYKAASSVGLSPGMYSSFQVNAQQFLGTSALESAANTQNDISKAGYLAALGIQYNAAQSMNAADLAFEELKRARAAYLQNPALAMQNPAIQSYLALGGSMADVRNAANVPLSQLLAAQNRTRGDAGLLGFSAQTAQAWANLKITLDKAGVSIETDLINKLGPLAPKLQDLAEGVINAVAAFLGGKNFDKVVEEAKDGIGDIAEFIKRTDWKQIGADISLVGSEIFAVAEKLKWLLPKKGDKGPVNTLLFGHGFDAKSYLKATMNLPVESGLRAAWQWLTHAGSGARAFLDSEYDKSPGGKALAWIMRGALSGYGGLANNPLDEKVYRNGQLAWGHYATTAEGIRANAHLLAVYGKQHLDTLSKIIPTWAPASDGNNPNGYLANVEKWSGVPRGLPMSQWSKAQFAAVISAMSREEGTDQVSIKQVVEALYGSDLAKVARSAAKAHAPTHLTVRPVARKQQRQRPPVHVSVTNSTAARVAVSLNAVAAS